MFTSLPQDPVRRQALLEAVDSLLHKRVVEVVENVSSPGFYSRFFVVPKKTVGKWRSILDLHVLNRDHIRTQRFKMDTAELVRQDLKEGDWATSVDLTDAYFQVKIHVNSRKYLRFGILGKVYQFRALVMGLSPSPEVFTMVGKPLKIYLQKRGVHIRQYLDDWLIFSGREDLTVAHTQLVVQVARQLGFLLNEEKSELNPKQSFLFLGYWFDLAQGIVRVNDDRWAKIQSCILPFLQKGTRQTALKWQSLLGLLVSTEKLVPRGMWHLRALQLALHDMWDQRNDSQEQLLPVSDQVREALTWWTIPANVCGGVPLAEGLATLQVFTDASLEGWGGHLNFQTVRGIWDIQERNLHINVLEMLAVLKVLKHFLHVIQNKHVLICSDNLTTVFYIKKQGGTRSREMMKVTHKLFMWLEEHQIRVSARHITGKLNVLADSLSRKGQIVPTEWSLCPQVVERLWQIWDKPMVDLFATRFNNKMNLFFSPIPDPTAMGVDALSVSWKGFLAYAFPPTAIVSKVLNKVEREDCVVILVAPLWTRQVWFPTLLELLVDVPVQLPSKQKLLKQPQSNVYHDNPQMMQLHAWRLSNRRWLREDFLKRLPSEWRKLRRDQALTSMSPSGGDLQVGVINGMPIPVRLMSAW